MSISSNLNQLKSTLAEEVTLVAVSKTKPISDLQEAYDAGQRVFGENKIQEMTTKWEELPKDIDQDLLKVEIINLSSKKAVKREIDQHYDWCMYTNLMRTRSSRSSPTNWTGVRVPFPTFTKKDGTSYCSSRLSNKIYRSKPSSA